MRTPRYKCKGCGRYRVLYYFNGTYLDHDSYIYCMSCNLVLIELLKKEW